MTAPSGPEARALQEAETPRGVIEWKRVRANAARVVKYLHSHGIAWRPHVKTHKSLEVARLQLDMGASGLTVATPHEAEVMSRVCDDLLLAYPAVGATKVARLIGLPDSIRLTVGLDSREALRPLAAGAAAAGRTIGILVELDMGLGRVGLQTPEEAVALASEVVDTKGVAFRGLMFYPGHIRHPVDEQTALLEAVSRRLGRFLAHLAEVGLRPEIVSGGSTPTLFQSHLIKGLTEVRPGTAIYQDRDIQAMNACGPDDIAYTVLATVVSTAVPGQAIVDAGSKALAKETFRSGQGGFGSVLGRPDVVVKALSEEHGTLDLSSTDWKPQVGDRVRIIPNHVCVSVNLQDSLLVLDGDATRDLPLDGRGRGPYPLQA